MLFFDGVAFAQSTGCIGGTVIDAVVAVIPNVSVTVPGASGRSSEICPFRMTLRDDLGGVHTIKRIG